jgi:acyl carrier protein
VAPDNRDELLGRISDYVQCELLGGADQPETAPELKPDTPLLEWGILNSLNTAKLLAYLRDELDVEVPLTHVTGRYFQDLDSVTDLVLSLRRS